MRIFNASGRQWRMVLTTAVVVLIGLSFAGRGNASSDKAPTFSAVQLTDAVLFNTGPAASYLESLQRPQVTWNDQMSKFRAAVDDVVTGDKQWGGEFVQLIQSGDPNQIKQAFEDLGRKSYDVLQTLYGQATVVKAIGEVNKRIDSQPLILDQISEFSMYVGDAVYKQDNVVVYRDAAVVSEAVVAVVVFAVAAWAVMDPLYPEAGRKEMLGQEMLIRTVAVHLAAGR